MSGTVVPLLTRHELWEGFQGVPMRIVATILGATFLRWLLHRVIRRAIALAIARGDREESSRTGRFVAHATGWSIDRHRQRLATLGTLLRSTVTLVVALVAILTIMSLLGLPLAPLLASAGVGGLALGFGAQSLVKDFLSGVFMIMEDQYGVGDVVDLGEVTGTVEDVSLRITTVRDANGVTWHVRNGEILRVGNKSQGWAQVVVDLPVGYDADVEKALQALDRVVADFAADPQWSDKVVDAPSVLGVESLVGGAMTLRMIAKCVAGQEFSVQRELRLRAKNALDAAGIPGPRPGGILPTPGGAP
ncbi:MAG: mechanosensitive ion channel family protein [Actinobacteria bacterium]|nr:mechanosensitive ion channel family protein [Actinomycetota bacterium]